MMSGNREIPSPEEEKLRQEEEQFTQDLKDLVTDLFEQIMAKFPPAARGESSTYLTTEEFTNLINDHVPGAINMRGMAVLLRKAGYVTSYDPMSNTFAWLVK